MVKNLYTDIIKLKAVKLSLHEDHKEKILLDKYVDTSLGALLYAFTVLCSRNRQVITVVQYENGKEQTQSGKFILTIGKKAVFLTRDREPVIVKRWTQLAIKDYLDQARIDALSLSGATIAGVYRDIDGWIWEGTVKDNVNYFNIFAKNKLLFTISF
ncbi:hypothetical protein [Desulfonatronovibrio magnus]|uniref:hypothetical protein n=1 Tax=Desulfonatronovibrio magnus TaxID=698827 RepID=UPI0005EB0985|nr:hypothetical protein [Desulfonatronovibrio magnus]